MRKIVNSVVNISKRKRLFCVLVLAFLMLIPGFTQAQSLKTRQAASQSWNTFWTKFRTAVKTKNRRSLIGLTSKRYSSPDGATISEGLDDVAWSRLRMSVNKGTKPYPCKRICRITRNADSTFSLAFLFENNRWGYTGEVGE